MRIHSKISTKIQPKRRILEDKMSMRIHQKCQQEFNYFLHKHLPFTSTRSLPPQLHIRHNFHSKNWVSYVCHYKIFVKFTYLIGMIAGKNFLWHMFYIFLSYGFGYGLRPEAEVFQDRTFCYSRRWKLHVRSNTDKDQKSPS